MSGFLEGYQVGQDWRRIRDNGKIADSIVKTNPEMLAGMGLNPDAFGALSARNKALAVEGYFKGQGAKELMDQWQQQERLRQLGEAIRSEPEVGPSQFAVPDDVRNLVRRGGLDLPGAMALGSGLQRYGAEAFKAEEGLRRRQALERFGELAGRDETMPPRLRSALRAGVTDPEDLARFGRAIEDTTEFTPGEPTPIGDTGYLRFQNTRGSWSAIPGPEVQARGRTAGKALAPTGQEWIYGEDKTLFLKNLLQVQDPATRDAIVEARRDYRASIGKGDDYFDQLLKQALGGGAAAGAGGGTGTEGKPDRVFNRQTGRLEKSK